MKKALGALARFLALATPLTIYLGMLAAMYLPGGTGMFSDGPSPWYANITGSLFFLGLLFSLPVKWISDAMYGGDAFLSSQYMIALAVYAVAIAYALHRLAEAAFPREQRRGTNSGY